VGDAHQAAQDEAQKVKTNATTSIWRRTPLLDARFHELLKISPPLTYTAIAARLSLEFDVHVTKNSCIGHGRRCGVPKRQPPRSYAGRKGRVLKPRAQPYAPKVKLMPRPKPRPKPGTLTLMQLEPKDCRWPEGDRAPFLFCGLPQLEGSSYCPEHTGRSCPSFGRER
jgi:hypothetical protein